MTNVSPERLIAKLVRKDEAYVAEPSEVCTAILDERLRWRR
jgi:hypothetical protein